MNLLVELMEVEEWLLIEQILKQNHQISLLIQCFWSLYLFKLDLASIVTFSLVTQLTQAQMMAQL
jgi:hypothetical protein